MQLNSKENRVRTALILAHLNCKHHGDGGLDLFSVNPRSVHPLKVHSAVFLWAMSAISMEPSAKCAY